MSYERKYLELLSREFPTVQAAATEYINLNAILNLPKGTEHFLTDIHGEYDAFNHFLKNASGIIREKIDVLFPELSEENRRRTAFFIYYPTDMLEKVEKSTPPEDIEPVLRDILYRLVELSRLLATKYTKSYVRKTLPEEFSYIIQELIYESGKQEDKERYYRAIVDAIFNMSRERKFIVQISKFIRNLAIDRLHIVGDIFDRGPAPHLVMEKLMTKRHVDIQWGNHDIIWMGAASGSNVSVANTVRIAARYNNLDCLEDGYGINLLPLARFAEKTYGNDPCAAFMPKGDAGKGIHKDELPFVAKIHKAITIIQFKLERDVIRRNPDFNLDDRLLLHKIDPDTGKVDIEGTEYPLVDTHFPTVDFKKDPYRLSDEEEEIINHLTHLFLHNEMLQKHAKYLFQSGSMFLKYNDNLLFHAAIPMHEDGRFMSQTVDGESVSGKPLFEAYEKKIRHAYLHRYEKQNPERDYFMMLWQGETSPLFAKHAMKTFERYFISDKKTHTEKHNAYFECRKDPALLDKIYDAFDLDKKRSKIINGHLPLDITKGHDVVLTNKRIYSIDGGMSKEYTEKTDIGGYTLISDSHAFYLVSHNRFPSYRELIEREEDIVSVTRSEEINSRRTYIFDTDKGVELKEKINDLARLIDAYRSGLIKEKPE